MHNSIDVRKHCPKCGNVLRKKKNSRGWEIEWCPACTFRSAAINGDNEDGVFEKSK